MSTYWIHHKSPNNGAQQDEALPTPCGQKRLHMRTLWILLKVSLHVAVHVTFTCSVNGNCKLSLGSVSYYSKLLNLVVFNL